MIGVIDYKCKCKKKNTIAPPLLGCLCKCFPLKLSKFIFI